MVVKGVLVALHFDLLEPVVYVCTVQWVHHGCCILGAGFLGSGLGFWEAVGERGGEGGGEREGT